MNFLKKPRKFFIIFIKNGKIEDVGTALNAEGVQVFDVKGACVSPGWLDLGTLVGDPGFEHREDFASVEKAAAAGGYTAIACLPNTAPAIHSKSEVQYVRSRSEASIVDFLPIGAVSHDCQGKDITEMYDPATDLWTGRDRMPTARSALRCWAMSANSSRRSARNG